MGEDIRHYLEGAQRKPIKGLRKILKEGLEVDSGNKYKADRVTLREDTSSSPRKNPEQKQLLHS